MNISRYANIDKFVNIRYIFLLARRAYSRLFQLAQMWKLLAPGVGLGDLLTPDVTCKFHFIATMFHIHVKGMVSHIVVLVRLVFLFFHLMICASLQVTSLSIKQILSLNPIF